MPLALWSAEADERIGTGGTEKRAFHTDLWGGTRGELHFTGMARLPVDRQTAGLDDIRATRLERELHITVGPEVLHDDRTPARICSERTDTACGTGRDRPRKAVDSGEVADAARIPLEKGVGDQLLFQEQDVGKHLIIRRKHNGAEARRSGRLFPVDGDEIEVPQKAGMVKLGRSLPCHEREHLHRLGRQRVNLRTHLGFPKRASRLSDLGQDFDVAGKQRNPFLLKNRFLVPAQTEKSVFSPSP